LQRSPTLMRSNNLLEIAIAYGNDASILDLMLQHGAVANRADEDGQTPLGLAILYGDLEAVKVLLRYHADPNRIAIIKPGLDGVVPINLAEQYHETEIANLLRDVGAKR